jgi:hypothetical protein
MLLKTLPMLNNTLNASRSSSTRAKIIQPRLLRARGGVGGAITGGGGKGDGGALNGGTASLSITANRIAKNLKEGKLDCVQKQILRSLVAAHSGNLWHFGIYLDCASRAK